MRVVKLKLKIENYITKYRLLIFSWYSMPIWRYVNLHDALSDLSTGYAQPRSSRLVTERTEVRSPIGSSWVISENPFLLSDSQTYKVLYEADIPKDQQGEIGYAYYGDNVIKEVVFRKPVKIKQIYFNKVPKAEDKEAFDIFKKIINISKENNIPIKGNIDPVNWKDYKNPQVRSNPSKSINKDTFLEYTNKISAYLNKIPQTVNESSLLSVWDLGDWLLRISQKSDGFYATIRARKPENFSESGIGDIENSLPKFLDSSFALKLSDNPTNEIKHLLTQIKEFYS